MDIKIPVNYPIGSTVYLIQGMQILAKEVTSVRIQEFTVNSKSATTPRPRYLLKDDSNIYYEQQLFGSPDELLSSLEEQVKSLTA